MSLGYRTGALSTFPSSADDFAIKTTFNAAGSQEIAAHFNHYFDAALNIETYLKTLLGGRIVSFTSKASTGIELSGVDVLLGATTLSVNLTSTGSITTISSTVPSAFGSDPFGDPKFSISPTLFLTPQVSGETLKGVAANNPDNSTYLNSLMNLPQFYGMIKPTGGAGFDYKIRILNSPFSGTNFSGVFFEDFNTLLGIDLGVNWSVQQTSGTSAWDIYHPAGSTGNVLRLWHKKSGGPSLGSTLIRPIESIIPSTTADQEVEFEIERRSGSTGFYRARVGPMVRCTGTTASANFYGVALSNTDSSYYTAQLVKIVGGDLSNSDSNNTWGVGSGTQADLGSSFTITTTAKNSGNQTARYKLTAQGTTLSVQEKIGSGSWTTLVSVTDSSLAVGRPGFFTKRCTYGSASTYVNFWIDDVYLRSLDAAPASGYRAEVRLIFAKIGSSTYQDIGTYT